MLGQRPARREVRECAQFLVEVSADVDGDETLAGCLPHRAGQKHGQAGLVRGGRRSHTQTVIDGADDHCGCPECVNGLS